MNRRKLELAVISDVHLGTYGCRAKELLLFNTREILQYLVCIV